ncbi:zinc-binding dehydrogenase [Mycobacterium sp.]|uniref:zinc-binding dehydrogenase n=1 Tax=Mycobacterium sp. TaxID=1785 RepID=UPI002B565426|nr:zinc-binding dehydrogenase [Mycobacterium sp.]HKP43877.1 zinc-binding dehydrogenase [Mycobacterium sp.]
MRAAVLRDGRMVLRDDVPEPVPGPGQVLVEVKACGICGSDLHFAKHGKDVIELNNQIDGFGDGGMQLDLNRDIFMGHEFSAEVLEAGPDTQAPAPGTLVTSLPVLVSATGVEPIVYSNKTIGGYAERMLLSAPLLTPIPDGLDPRHAALTEPMAVGLHAVNKSAIQPGEVALVLGCGPIGLAIIAGLRHRGVESIVAADYSARRRELAETMGATATVDPADGSPFESATPRVVFEAVGVPGIIDDILRRAPVGARVVVAGVCMQPDTVHPYFAIAKQINVQFVLAYDPNEFTDCLRAIAEGDIDVAPMITGEVGLAGVGAAFDELAHPDTHCKVLVTPSR